MISPPEVTVIVKTSAAETPPANPQSPPNVPATATVIKKGFDVSSIVLAVLFGTMVGMGLSLAWLFKLDKNDVVLHRDGEKLVWVRTDEPWKDKPSLPRGPLEVSGRLARVPAVDAFGFKPSGPHFYRLSFFVPGARDEPTMVLDFDADSPLETDKEITFQRGVLWMMTRTEPAPGPQLDTLGPHSNPATSKKKEKP